MRIARFSLCFALSGSLAFAQSASMPVAPTNMDDLTNQTNLSKAQQAYYDQLLATTKSQQAAATANIANRTSLLTQQGALQQAQMSNDLAVSSAIKGSGLSAATGKQGNITLSSGNATLLALQRGSLVATDKVASQVCNDLRAHGIHGAFIAPANFESLVEKGLVDLIQLRSLHQAAVTGADEFKAAQLQVAGAALAGALVSTDYLAGGIQTIASLFRNDYSVSVNASSRPNLFEQRVTSLCGNDVITYNLEGTLRLNAVQILVAWVPDMATFAQQWDIFNDQVTAQVASLNTQKTQIPNDAPDAAARKNGIEMQLKAYDQKLAALAKYKSVAAAIKTYLAALNSTASLFDSIVWAQDVLFDLGGIPNGLSAPGLRNRPRFTFTLNAQDAAVTKSSVLFSNTLTGVSTVEAYYAVVDNSGIKASGVYSATVKTPPMKFDKPALEDYSQSLPQIQKVAGAKAK
jgi:hypothetical protein